MTHALALSGAILFGLIAASMIWRSGESEEASSFISQISPLTLVFLLSEVNPSSKPPRVTWAASSVVFRLARRLPWAQYSSAKKPPRICAVGLPLGRYTWPMDLLP
ncbi:MAG: hypothetical protein FJ010_13880 [Chloroflexi bacterium]|nr:hypothetical protein [Chloroflexota bacterium]